MRKNNDTTGVERRNFLKGITLSGTSLLGAGGLAANATGQTNSRDEEETMNNTTLTSGDAVISVDPSATTDWTINKRIFGKFIEHNGRDAYPGIYSDHVANGSFEVWNTPTAGDRTAVLYSETPTYDEIAYPWEPVVEDGSIAFTQTTGGIHGREAEPDLESGEGVPANLRPTPSGVTQPRYQRISLSNNGATARGGVKQRTALPDDRTLEYDIEF
jgi:alpha-L-arabinofuranosidase